MLCPECEKDLRVNAKRCSCGWVAEAPPAKTQVKCCLCHHPVLPSGWCEACRSWPINVTPIRVDERGHRIDTDGFCPVCQAFTGPHLEAQPGEWIDTGRRNRRVIGEEYKAEARTLIARMSRPGWPEVPVPIRRDWIPRRWSKAELQVVGETPLGYETVLPRNAMPEEQESEVPF